MLSITPQKAHLPVICLPILYSFEFIPVYLNCNLVKITSSFLHLPKKKKFFGLLFIYLFLPLLLTDLLFNFHSFLCEPLSNKIDLFSYKNNKILMPYLLMFIYLFMFIYYIYIRWEQFKLKRLATSCYDWI